MIYIILIVLGLALGSFVNALVWRLHELETKPKLSKKTKRELSIVQGRSMCPHCKHVLKWYDLLPVVSWLSLKGKCRYCGKSIPDSPLVELMLPAVFILSYAFWPVTLSGKNWFDFVVWLIVWVGLVALLVYDLKWMILPNKIVYSLLFIVLGQRFVDIIFLGGGSQLLLEVIYGLLIGGGIFYLLFQISGGKWIGGGDVKLGALLGMLLGGPGNALLLIFIASLLGSLFTVPMIISKKAKSNTKIAFGPFLIIATLIVQLAGAGIIAWYRRKFLV